MQIIVAILAALVGAAFCFGGFRFFLLLLPIWGFVTGFSIGTDAVSAFLGETTFATVTSWVVGFGLAIVFAIFSYLYYWAAIAVLGGIVGYQLGVSAWGLIGSEQNVIAFILGIVCAVVLAVAVLALNVPRYLVIVLTGLGGAALVVAGWFILTGQLPVEGITWVAIGAELTDGWIGLIIWGVVAAAGILVQMFTPPIGPDQYELERGSYRYS
jgi:hypothetical protein